MADKLPDASERAERYGIDRRVWRVAMLILFTVLAVTGCLMSIALGAADISVSQVRLSGIYGCPEPLWAPW